MALYDHRVFRISDEWWVAQVHGASGAGSGQVPLRMTADTVYFTSLTNSNRKSVVASIPSGWLNQLSYRSLLEVMRSGDIFADRMPMAPYNAPSREELGRARFTDEEGLEWTFKPIRVVRTSPDSKAYLQDAAELICLDDSALRGEVLLEDFSVLDNYLARYGPEAIGELVSLVKSTFRDYAPSRSG